MPAGSAAGLSERIAALGLSQNAVDLVVNGYTVLEDAAPLEFFERLRARIVKCVDEAGAVVRSGMLLARGRIFEKSVCTSTRSSARCGRRGITASPSTRTTT